MSSPWLANIGACSSYFFHPLLCIVRSWPIETINTEMPRIRVASLPANDFHASLVGSEFLGSEIEAGDYFPRLAYDKIGASERVEGKEVRVQRGLAVDRVGDAAKDRPRKLLQGQD